LLLTGMSQISRRCPVCGASVRARAAFCPQCGKRNANRAPNDADDNLKTQKRPAGDAEWLADSPAAVRGQPELGRRRTRLDSSSQTAFEAGGSRATIHRATAAARNAIEENVVMPVKMLRVVLEEAAYDPSLRFVLVAAGLFILFLVLLILSEFVG
jgi:zinc ribbon protein